MAIEEMKLWVVKCDGCGCLMDGYPDEDSVVAYHEKGCAENALGDSYDFVRCEDGKIYCDTCWYEVRYGKQHWGR